MRIVRISLLAAVPMFAFTGCISVSPPPTYVVPAPADGGVVMVEPAPEYRVYVYDPGFPPGAYSYNGYYYYQGRRYERDYFVHSYVEPNRRAGRYLDRDENHRRAVETERNRGVTINPRPIHPHPVHPTHPIHREPGNVHPGEKPLAHKPGQAGGENAPEKKQEPER